MKKMLLAAGLVAAASLTTLPAIAADCDVTIGLVMELTGPAGAYGQAGAKAVEMAFRDFNDAGGLGTGCKLVTDTRDSQSQGTVAVDQATQLVNIKKVRDHRRHHFLDDDSDPYLRHSSGRGGAGVAGLVVADADGAGPRRQDQRHLLPHHHLGCAARHGGGEICHR